MYKNLKICALLGVLSIISVLNAGGVDYFVDGYHGGIYGHYPVKWKTQFIVDKVQQNPMWRIGLEIEPETWDTVAVRTPEAYAQFRQLLLSGERMEYTNPTYAQPYCYNISGESLIRQLRYGIDKLHSHFPCIKFTTYAVEEPCFTSCLPAVLKGFGFKYVSLKCPNTCWGGYMAPYGGQLVDWVGSDGTTILTVPRYGCEALEDNSVWQTTAWGNSRKYLEACHAAGIENPVGMCYQDAGWRNGPWLGRRRGQSQYILWSDYIENHTDHGKAERHHFTQDDIRVNLMWGTQVLQRIARHVRAAENSMVMAEKIGAMTAMATGVKSPLRQDSIDEAWRQLLLAQHHDSWIVPYNGLKGYGTWADAIATWTGYASTVASDEIARLSALMATGSHPVVKVFNTTSQLRSEVVAAVLPDGFGRECESVVVTDYAGAILDSYIDNADASSRRVVFKATVPPFGYATYRLSRSNISLASETPIVVDSLSTVLENDRVRVVVDLIKGGTVKSLKLKSGSGVEFAPADTSRFSLCELRGFFYDEDVFRSSVETAAKVVARKSTPLEQSLTVEGSIAGHRYLMSYRLTDGSSRVDCSLHIEWDGCPGIGEYREEHWNHDRRAFCDDRFKLCLLLPTSFSADRLWKDAPFDVCETAQESTVFNRWSEIKHNVILNWIDFTDKQASLGMGLLTDHTTSYVHDPNYPTALTLQYSGQGLWGRNHVIDRPTDVAFALLPHEGCGGGEYAMADESDRFNEPLIAVCSIAGGDAAGRSFIEIDNPGYRLSSVSTRPDGRKIVRVFNSFADGKATLKIQAPSQRLKEVDLMDNPVAKAKEYKASKSGELTVTLDIPKNGFKTFAIY